MKISFFYFSLNLIHVLINKLQNQQLVSQYMNYSISLFRIGGATCDVHFKFNLF